METLFLVRPARLDRLIIDHNQPGGLLPGGIFNIAWVDGTIDVWRDEDENGVPYTDKDGNPLLDQDGNPLPTRRLRTVPNLQGKWVIKSKMPFQFAVIEISSSAALLQDLITKLDAMGLNAPAVWIGRSMSDSTGTISTTITNARIDAIKNWVLQWIDTPAEKAKMTEILTAVKAATNKREELITQLLNVLGMTRRHL